MYWALAMGREHVRVVDRMMEAREAEAAAEEAWFQRKRRRARFQRIEVEGYLTLAAGLGRGWGGGEGEQTDDREESGGVGASHGEWGGDGGGVVGGTGVMLGRAWQILLTT